MNSELFQKMFIDEAKPALSRHNSQASYNTCTVTITANTTTSVYISAISASVVNDGVIEVYKFLDYDGVETVVIENVLCGCPIVAMVNGAGSSSCLVTVDGGVVAKGQFYNSGQQILVASSDGTATIFSTF